MTQVLAIFACCMKSADEETLASGRWREGKRPLAVGRDLGLHEGGGEEASVVAVDDAAFYIQLPSLHSLQKIWVSSWREALRMIPRESLIGSMERQISHRHASSSGSSGIHALTMKNNKPESKLLPHPLPNSSCLQDPFSYVCFVEGSDEHVISGSAQSGQAAQACWRCYNTAAVCLLE